MSRVVVVGGGYGGWAVAKALDADTEVVLIDPRDAFVNAAGSLRALTRPDWAGNMFFPFKTLLKRGTVLRDRAVSVDSAGVDLASGGRVEADYVVLATGSRYPYPAKPVADSVEAALEDLLRTHKELAAAGRVLILGAGPVGLELAGEIVEVWPDKKVTVVDPAAELLPGFLPQVRNELHRQLDELGIHVRLGAGLVAAPGVEPGRAETFTATTTDGETLTADIWFRAYGVDITSDYLADGRLTTRTPGGAVPVLDTLQVTGHDKVYAVGDLTDLPEAKRAGYAMKHAEVVADNIRAQLLGRQPTAAYVPVAEPMILLPLGTRGGVGQMPGPDGPVPAATETVVQYKGADLFTGRFADQFTQS
jgi:NADH dehydrogenase FAD-containing subunit